MRSVLRLRRSILGKVTSLAASRQFSENVGAAAGPTTVLERSAPTPRVVDIVDEVCNLNLMELSDLSFVLMKELRIGPDELPIVSMMNPGGMPTAAAQAGSTPGSTPAAEVKAEKTAFEVKLESYDAASKIKIIKEVRSVTSLGLKEAKELVEKAPTVIKGGVSKEEAENIMEKMKAVGAVVVIE